MKKISLIALIVAVVTVGLVSISSAEAKEYITGYDVNNGYAPVLVEKGVYVPGISLYPYATETVGSITTKGPLQAANITATGDLSVGGDATVGDDLTVTGDDVSVNGTYLKVSIGSFTSASTTVFSVANPFGASSSASLIFKQTGKATSSYSVACGTSTSAYGSVAAPSDKLIDDIVLATSTLHFIVSGLAGTNGHYEIPVGANEYVMCKLTASGELSAIEDSSNSAWAGRYTIYWKLPY